MISVGWRLRDGISAHNTRQLMSAHPLRASDHSTRLRCQRTDDNEHYTPLFARAGCERRASQAAKLRSERMEAQCLYAFALPMSPRHASPSHARRAERCDFPGQHTADLAGLLLLFVCVPPPACLLEAHARSSQTHKDCIVSLPSKLLSSFFDLH